MTRDDRTDPSAQAIVRDPLARLLAGAGIGHFRLDLDTMRIDWSDVVYELHGVQTGRFEPNLDSMLGLVEPCDVPTLHASVEAAREGTPTVAGEYRLRDSDRWLSYRATVVRDNGATREVIGMVTDITERKQREHEMALREQRYRRLAEEAPVGIGQHREGRVTYANAVARRLLGGSRPDELVGTPLFDLVHPADREEVAERLGRLVTTDEMVALREEHLLDLDGRSVMAAVAASRGLHPDDDVVTVIFVDLTEQKRLEEQLRHSQRLESLGRLAGGIAHDFNNLLTAILGNAELARLGSLDEEALCAVDGIEAAGERAARITSQLLAFARHRVVETRPVDTTEVLDDLHGLLEHLIGEQVTLIVDDLDAPWPVSVDPAGLEQVLVNLVVNARDAMPGGGTVSITVDPVEIEASPSPELSPGSYLQIAVHDEGTGVDPAQLDLIFEPFFTTKGPRGGTGLGLSTCLGIVRQAGGDILVESTVGEGSTFSIYLPRAPGRAPSEAPRPTGLARGTETILLVEDEPMVLQVTEAALRAAGFHVLSATDATEALVAADAAPRLDALITDVVLPGPSGLAIASALRERYPGLKVLYVSGYTADRLEGEPLEAPDTAFLHKPHRPSELARTLRQLLDDTAS